MADAKTTLILILLLGAGLWLAAGCGADDPPVTDSVMEEAARFYKTKCFTCHGTEGRGDGPMSASLNPAPRNHTDPAWQDSVDDEFIRRVILEGGRSVGLSPLMPATPELRSRPELVKALIRYIRAFRSSSDA